MVQLRQMVPTQEAAKFLGISEDYLYNIRQGNLKWKKEGCRTFYSKSSLSRLLAKKHKSNSFK